jgi:hypothetical protein
MSDKKRSVVKILLLGIACFSAVAFALVVPSPVSTVAAAAIETPSGKPDCEILCSDSQSGCDPGDHVAFNPDDPGVTWLNGMRRLGSHPYTCFEGECPEKHDVGQCQAFIITGESPLTPENLQELRQAVVAADATEVQALLKTHPSQLSFNAKRSAIQVMACNGRVKEHMPLSSVMAKQLVVATH